MTVQDRPPSVLVSAGSKHGATAEIAEHIGATLRRRGLEVTVAAPGEVDTLEGHDAVVLGSAVYAGHWLDDAKELARKVGSVRPAPRVWLFSSGPVGDPPRPEEDPVDVADLHASTQARHHRVFAGKIDKTKLGFAERAIMVAVRAPEGDFRDWDDIADWAEGIARALLAEAGSPAGGDPRGGVG